jgi:hypothetical protein
LFGNEAGAHILMLSCEGPVEMREAEAVKLASLVEGARLASDELW